jgi:predicted TIM-barrel fold metal-dependent hydrolase
MSTPDTGSQTPSLKLCLASADGHVGAPTEVYRDYLEQRLHPFFDEFLARHRFRWSAQHERAFLPRDFNVKMWDTEGFDPARGTAITWDPELRRKALDQELVACEVLIPDEQNMNDAPFESGLSPATIETPDLVADYPWELVRAGARAYNRWLADFCSVDPHRLLGATILGKLDDVVWCADEVERAYESGLRTAVVLPLHSDLPLYHHPRYDPLWHVCSELGLPVISHVGTGHPLYLGEDPVVQYYFFANDMEWHAKRPVECLVMGGVLERFPDLHLVPTEMGVDWVAPMLEHLDRAATGYHGQASPDEATRRADLSMTPSEYWQRQCFVTHSVRQRREDFEGDAFDAVPNMVFGMDTGHCEGNWPFMGTPQADPTLNAAGHRIPCDEFAKELLGGLPAAKMVPFLQDNFFRAFPNVDQASLNDVVSRIGPTATELGLV